MNKIRRFLKKCTNVGLTFIFALAVIIYILPIIITFTNSFMGQSELSRNYGTARDVISGRDTFINMYLIPEKVTLSQYAALLVRSPVYLNMFVNSVKIVLPIITGQLVVSAMAAYAFCVLKFKGKEALFFVYIIVMLLPLQVTMLPNYIIADLFDMTDSYLAIILPGIFSPFGVFLLRQFMKAIPDSYIESAKIDGAGHAVIFGRIVLPMVKGGLASAMMLSFADYWNLVDQAVIFIRDDKAQPLSLFLASINKQQMGVAFAGSCFYALPALILLFHGQDYLKSGIAISGLKL